MAIQLDLSAKSASMLDDLKLRTGINTSQDLLNNAITLLDWAVGQKEFGFKICSVDKDCIVKELHMPALEFAARRFAARKTA